MALLDLYVHSGLLLFAKWPLEEESNLIAGCITTIIACCDAPFKVLFAI